MARFEFRRTVKSPVAQKQRPVAARETLDFIGFASSHRPLLFLKMTLQFS